jgi:hypothetical protein
MIFLQDDESKQQLMVDTGAICSVLPHRSKTSPTGPQLSSADGKAIPCWVSVCRRLTFGLHTFFVTVLLAAIYRPILGLDLCRPLAAGWPSRPPGAGLEVSETALQTNNRHRDPALQICRRPLLHSTDGTVLVSLQARVPVDPGKRSSHRELNTLRGGMIFLQDDESKQQLMVDTGAISSVLPHRSKTSPTGPQLSSAKGKAIPCWARVRRRLTFGLHTFFVTLLLAAIYRPILGLDLCRPLAAGWPSRPPGAGLEVSETALQTNNCRRDPALQIRRRPLLHSTDGTVLVGFFPSHRRRLEMKTIAETQDPPHNQDGGPPCVRQGPAAWTGQAAPGRSRVPRAGGGWHHPPFRVAMVCKKDRSWRPCGDYRQLNLAMTHDCYPPPSILDLSNKLHGCKFFSCIDLVKGYHQIPMAVQVPLHAFRTTQRRTDFSALHGQPVLLPG